MMIFFKKTCFLLVLQFIALGFCNVQAHTTGSEITYLQTDRTTYITGETVFYKLYVLDAKTKKCSAVSKVGYVLIRPANLNPVLKIRIKLDAGLANGSIVLPDTLASGVYQIVAFTSQLKNSNEQHLFHKEIVIANRFDKELNYKLINSDTTENNLSRQSGAAPEITTDKQVYGQREKVKASLGKTNSKATVAVSVYEESPVLLPGQSIVKALNELQPAPIGKQIYDGSLPESSGKILRGRVIDTETGKTIPSAMVFLSCIDSVPNLQYTVTNSNGIFQLLLSDYYNGKELFLTIDDMPEDKHWKIEVEDEFNLSEKWRPALIPNNGNSKEFIVKSQNIVYINKSYQLNTDLNEELIPDQKPILPWFYYCPVQTLLPSDFVPLDDFPEIAVELLPMVRINKHNGKYKVEIINASTYLINDRGPAIFLDGVFIDDVSKIIGLGSERIKKIELVGTERVFGNLVFQGVISITSKSTEIANTIPLSNSLRLKNTRINNSKSFVAVHPDAIQDKTTPYFKQLLYWNPDLKSTGTGSTDFEFYTSDNPGRFIIKAEGITEDGIPFSATSSIQVDNQLNAPTK